MKITILILFLFSFNIYSVSQEIIQDFLDEIEKLISVEENKNKKSDLVDSYDLKTNFYYTSTEYLLFDKNNLSNATNNELQGYIVASFENQKNISKKIFLELKSRNKLISIDSTEYNIIKFNLGISYYFTKKYLKVFYYIYQAAKNGYPQAQYTLSRAYKRGYFSSININHSILRHKNPLKSVKWAFRSKEAGFPPAINYINLLENNNKNIEKEFVNSCKIIKNKNKQMDNKNINIREKIYDSKYKSFFRVGLLKDDSMFNSGLSYLLDKNYLKAFVCFYQLSKSNSNDAETSYFISKVYHKAYDSIKKTFFTQEELWSDKFSISDKKHKYLKKAAKNNLAIAQYKLGIRYENKNIFKKAIKYFLSGALQRHPASQFKIATFYFDGIYVKQDQKKGISYFKKSAKNGYTEAQKKLITIYLKGLGVKKSEKQAFYWLKKLNEESLPPKDNNLYFLEPKYKSF